MKEKAIGKIIEGLLICLMIVSVFGGIIDATSATNEKTTVSVTESSPWFTKGSNSGHPELWYSHTYQGHNYISTYVGGMSGNPSQPDCWAEFKPYLSQSGKYEVYAYFYACKDTSTKVPFTVKYDGSSTTIKVNQYRSSPAWKERYLGTWNFKAGTDTYVKVTDATGETYNSITGLSVGAIKFVKVQTTTVPSPPRNLRVTEVGSSYVKIAWDTPSSDGGSPITNYKIYRGTSSGTETLYYTTSTAGTTFNNCANIVNGVTYYYKVKAVNAVDDSDFSKEVSATPTSGTSVACFDGQRCYSTKEEAVSHVPTHVVPRNCFVWNDGPTGYPWRPIPGTGCAHWVAHQLGIRRGATCHEGHSIRVSDVIYGRTEVEISSCKVGDIWTNSDRTHCGIVRQLGNGKVWVEHDSSGQGGVVKNWFSTGKCWTLQQNHPPNTPSTPSGSSSGYTGTSYSYSASTTDHDGNKVKYTFDWGEGPQTTTGFYNSGATATVSHSWSNEGTCYVKVKATDSKGASSGWSSSKTVTIERQKHKPSAYIDSISPNPAKQGQTVSFAGHGTDPDGDLIIAYNWRPSINGFLSSSKSFSKSDLSVGTHTIYFKVKDRQGLWSDETTKRLTINSPSAVTAAIDKQLLDLIDQHASIYYNSAWNLGINQYKAWIATIAWAEGGRGGYAAHSQYDPGSDVFDHRVAGKNFRFSTGIGPFQIDRGGYGYKNYGPYGKWGTMPTIEKLNYEKSLLEVLTWHYKIKDFGKDATLADFSKEAGIVWYGVKPEVVGTKWKEVTGTNWNDHKKGKANLDWSSIKDRLVQNAKDPSFRYESNVKFIGTLKWNIKENGGIKTDTKKKVIFDGFYPTWLIISRNGSGREVFKYYYTYNSTEKIEVWVWDNSPAPVNKFRYIFVREYSTGPFPEGKFGGETLTSSAIGEAPAPIIPSATLSVSPKEVSVGDPITIKVDGKDDTNVKYLSAYYSGNWHRHECTGIQTHCGYSWTTSESSPGSYKYYGYIKDNEGNGAWSTPKYIEVTVNPSSSPPSATLSVSPKEVSVGDPITIKVDGKDDTNVKYLSAYYSGNWHRHECTGIQTHCGYSWTTSESSPGSYKYYGYIKDNEGNGAWSTPKYIEVTFKS